MNFRMIIVAALGRQISIVGQAEIAFLYHWEEFCKISYLIQETDLKYVEVSCEAIRIITKLLGHE